MRAGAIYPLAHVEAYPCGCVFKVVRQGYQHFVNPECPYHTNKTGSSNYEYRPWEKRPKAGKGTK